MSDDIKNTAVPLSGYIYQNRQGLRVLCDWLDAPSRYSRVKFECDDEAVAPQGLDDIVVERADRRTDLHQVKYTPNHEAHPLSWDWLLEKSGKTNRSRSMLRKWFDSFMALDPARIGELKLVTNRRPDMEIEACIECGKISLGRVPEPRRTEVIGELGASHDCEVFFSLLHIHHSDKGFETLEQEVEARLRKHGTFEGIANLKNHALNWATQVNHPQPDGWIKIEHVRNILGSTPPAPLPEDFVVPIGYEVPDEAFHQEFLHDTIGTTGGVIVLTGPPGRGKSTYLSALCDGLAEQDIPTVRHHYFLSTTERDRDRVNSYMVEQSIVDQVKRYHPAIQAQGDGLRSHLEACASHYKGLNKPFVLVLDGLDHVWRINAGDKRPLDDLFAQVIPPPDNMVLLVGTQPVDDAQLPRDLLVFSPKSEWRELPAMTENAVLAYLRKAVQEGRLIAGFQDVDEAERQLHEAATALRTKTNGHPLHVIYAAAELEHTGQNLSRWCVEQLKGDLSKDVKSYYASLWVDLLPSLKDTLHLVCAFSFFWPREAFGEITSVVGTANPDVAKVEHLLHSSAAGLKVFHESLAVFVRSTADYPDRIKVLMPAVEKWLENTAPASLRVNWLWTVQAKLGNPKNLISGLTRDWIMLRLEEGYPESLFDTLLSDALDSSLKSNEFSEAYRLAHLKDRMVGNSQFQLQDDEMARLIWYTLALSTEESVVREAVASRHETDILRVAALGLALHTRGNIALARTCGEEALRRYIGSSRFSSRYSSSADSDEFKFLVIAFSQLGAIGETTATLAKLVSENSPIVWLPRIQMLVHEGCLDDLMEVAASLKPGKNKSILSDECIRAAATAGVSITQRDDFIELSKTPFLAAVAAAQTHASMPLNEPIPTDWLSGDYKERKGNLATLAHHWFFSAVHVSLIMAADEQTAFEFVRAPKYEGRRNITKFLDVLSAAGAHVAQKWWRGEFVDFHELYDLFETVEFKGSKQSHDESSAAKDFRSALHRIACDIRLGSIQLGHFGDVSLSKETFEAARQSAWFDGESFQTQYAAGLLTRMSDEATAAFIHSQRAQFETEVRQETSVHLQTPLKLCAIALAHGQNTCARELCRQAWELTTGYVHRKDRTLNQVVDAIGYLVDAAPDASRRLLDRIAPQIHHILNYTDGKETRHVLADADRLLAKLKPTALVTKYEEHTYAGDWSEAENSLLAYIEQGIKEGWPLDALMRTGVQPKVQDLLIRLMQEGALSAAERLRVLREHVGWDIGVLKRSEYQGNKTEDQTFAGDVTSYSPEQIDDLLESLSSIYYDKPRLLRIWYEHWDKAGQGRQLLAALDGLLMSEDGRHKGVLILSDLAFHTKRKLSGCKAAWKYLVHAHILNGAWHGGYAESYKETCRRLDLVVKYYPTRCDEFVAETTFGMFGVPESLRVAPSELMVYFYVKQNRIANAVLFAEMMVNCVIEDTRTLPIQRPRWAAELVSPELVV